MGRSCHPPAEASPTDSCEADRNVRGQPLDPNAAVAGTPGTTTPPATPEKKAVKKKKSGGGGGGTTTGTKKAEPKKKSEVVDPFG